MSVVFVYKRVMEGYQGFIYVERVSVLLYDLPREAGAATHLCQYHDRLHVGCILGKYAMCFVPFLVCP